MRQRLNLLCRSCFYATSFLVAMLLCVSVGTGGPYCNAADSRTALPRQIRTAAELKIRAEEWAADLKKSYDKKGKKNNSEEEYRNARTLYVDARAAIEGWVAALQTEIELGRDIAKSEGYSESLQTAAAKADEFIANAQSLLASRSGNRGTPIVGDLFKVLGDSGVQVWKEYRSEKQKQKETLVKRLEGLKWKPFDGT